MTGTAKVLVVSYNLVWWVPVALPLFDVISYRAGTLGFLAVTAARAAINAYRNNVLPFEKGASFPLRSP
jgi:hypothetical protein